MTGTVSRTAKRSEFLLVLCSPSAAQSRWVNEEIRYFKSLGRESRIIAIVLDGEPNASYANKGEREDLECFPSALRYWVDENGNTTDKRVEPLAADLRDAESPTDKSERELIENEFLRITAGILNIGYDELFHRDHRRRVRKYKIFASLCGMVMAFLIIAMLPLYYLMWGTQENREDMHRLIEEATAGGAEMKEMMERSKYDMGLMLMKCDASTSKQSKEERMIDIEHMEEKLNAAADYMKSKGYATLRREFCHGATALAKYYCIDKEYDKALTTLERGESFALTDLIGVDIYGKKSMKGVFAELLITKAYVFSLLGKTTETTEQIDKIISASGGADFDDSVAGWIESARYDAKRKGISVDVTEYAFKWVVHGCRQ